MQRQEKGVKGENELPLLISKRWPRPRAGLLSQVPPAAGHSSGKNFRKKEKGKFILLPQTQKIFTAHPPTKLWRRPHSSRAGRPRGRLR